MRIPRCCFRFTNRARVVEPAQAADKILAGLARGAFEIHFPRRFTYAMKLLALLPAPLYLPLLRWLTA